MPFILVCLIEIEFAALFSLHYSGHAPSESCLGQCVVAITSVVSAPAMLGGEWHVAHLR